jgi:hypothetical protein
MKSDCNYILTYDSDHIKTFTKALIKW